MSEKIDKKQIGEVVTGLFDVFEKETKEKYGELGVKMAEKLTGINDFHYDVIRPMKQIIDLAIRHKYADVDRNAQYRLAYLFSNHEIVQRNFEKLIVQLEGTACSVDKSGYLIGQIKKYLAGEIKCLDVTPTEKSFWHTGFWNTNNGEEWLRFFEAIFYLQYGDNKKYLEFIKSDLMELYKSLQK